MSFGSSVPGTSVPSGVAVAPGGPPGIPGPAATTTVVSGFTVPPLGATVQVTLTSAAWIVPGQMIYIAGAGGGGTAGDFLVQTVSGNLVTLQNLPASGGATGGGDMYKAVYDNSNRGYVDHAVLADSVPYLGITNAPLASTSGSGLMTRVTGVSTDYLGGDNACHNLVSAIQPTIWSARLRNFNALGNPTFEVDQRNAGTAIAQTPSTWFMDRWQNIQTVPTMRYSGGQSSASNVYVPGTSFQLSRSYLSVSLTTQQASLAAGDYAYISGNLEGPRFRELQYDVTSLSLLVYTSIPAGLKIAVALRDPQASYSLVKLVTVPGTGAWGLVQFPALPLWPSGGNFSNLPGNGGYIFSICFACGSTYMAPSAGLGTWQSGNFVGAPGMDNFGSFPVNSVLGIGFVQHEPGPLCTTLIDCPFTTNLDDCLRYYTESYDGVKAGTVTGTGRMPYIVSAPFTSYFIGNVDFKKIMAKTPTINIYNDRTGAINAVDRNGTTSVALNATPSFYVSAKNLGQFALASALTAGDLITFHYTADTGW